MNNFKDDIDKNIGTKDDADKLDLTFIDPYFIEGITQVMEYGAKKMYTRGNWQLDLDPRRILAAELRHDIAMLKGEMIDSESGLHHSLHNGCNNMFLYYYWRHGRNIKTEHNKG